MPNCRSWFAVDVTAFGAVTSRLSAFIANMTRNSSVYSCSLRLTRCRTKLCRSYISAGLERQFGWFHQYLIGFKRSTSSQSGFSSIGRIWRSYHWTRIRTSYNSLMSQNIRFKNSGVMAPSTSRLSGPSLTYALMAATDETRRKALFDDASTTTSVVSTALASAL